MYSAYDKQCNRYLNTGRNSPTKEKCIEAAVDYLLEDDDCALPYDMTFESLLECAGIEIIYHRNRIESED